MAQAALIAPSELPLYGASSDFMAQFNIRAITITIVTGGALGTMQFQWGFPGELNGDGTPRVSPTIQSEAGSPWPYSLPIPTWCDLTFIDGTYTAGAVYTVSRTGAVTGPNALITAVRNNLPQTFCDEVTSDAVTRMQPRVVPPVLVPGVGVKGACGRIVVYRLKSYLGLTPKDAGSGDDNVRMLAEDALKYLDRIGQSDKRPPDLVDSSANNIGAGVPHMPVSRRPRGFNRL